MPSELFESLQKAYRAFSKKSDCDVIVSEKMFGINIYMFTSIEESEIDLEIDQLGMMTEEGLTMMFTTMYQNLGLEKDRLKEKILRKSITG